MNNKENYPTLGPIIIGTRSIEKAKDFYIKVFGLTVEDERQNYLSGRAVDGTHIELEEDSENRFPNWEQHNIGTYKNSEFQVKNIFIFLKSVENYGGKVISHPEEKPWGGYAAEISDLDGNIFLIAQK